MSETNIPEAATVEAIATLARKAQSYAIHQRSDGTTVAIWPNGGLLELTPVVPAYKRAAVLVDDLDSFLAYAEKHATPGTLVALRWKGPVLVADATLDHHQQNLAGWAVHRCTAELCATESWAAWLANDRTSLKQASFAEFLEDRLQDIREPSAGVLMDIVTTLETSTAASFKSGMRLQNGDREFAFKHTSEARAGQDGKLTVPEKFAVAIVPYPGADAVTVFARLKYRTASEGLTFRYEIEGLDVLRKHLLEVTRAKITEKLPSVLVVLGLADRNGVEQATNAVPSVADQRRALDEYAKQQLSRR